MGPAGRHTPHRCPAQDRRRVLRTRTAATDATARGAVRDGRLFTPRFDRYGQIPVRTNRYSVPIRLIGKRVRVVLHASHLVVYDQNVEVARHERLIAKGAVRLELDHYLKVLVRKPGAFPGAVTLLGM